MEETVTQSPIPESELPNGLHTPATIPGISLSPSISVLTAALRQVNEVLSKSDETFKLLQDNLQQVNAQRIAMNAQKQMLTELITKIRKAELSSTK